MAYYFAECAKAAKSAFGAWSVHLKGALNLITAVGGAKLLSKTPNSRVKHVFSTRHIA